MKTIQVYDPPMCCSTGVCGTDIDPDLVSFASMLSQLGGQGVEIERYNMGQQAMAFAENETVKTFLEKEGVDVLPIIFVNGELYLKGRYPTSIERPALSRAVLETPSKEGK